MIPDWTLSLSHLIFLSIIFYLWKNKSKLKIQIARYLILAGCLWGLHWIFISLNQYGGLNYFVASLATVILACYVASYYLVAGIIIRKLELPPVGIASIVCLAEWTKSNFLTGFPWLNIGVMQIDSPFSVFAPFLGAYGVGFMVVYFAALIANATKLTFIPISIICLLIIFLGSFSNFTKPNGKILNVTLVQGAIPQNIKFDPDQERISKEIHLDLINTAMQKNKKIDLVVLPETAFTRIFSLLEKEHIQEIKNQLSKHNSILMMGIPKRNNNNWRNSLIALKVEQSSELQIYDSYDKHHLVPFGEFIPWGFKWFVNMMQIPLGEFERGLNPQKPIKVKDQYVGVNICFEDLFGDEISSIFTESSYKEKPSILLNISNLGWFGDTNALDYHLKASRMRSLETGRPMLRATNTGVTALINHKGVVLNNLETFERNYLNVEVQGTSGQTLYNFLGNYLVLFFSWFVLGFFSMKKKFYKS